MRCFSLHQKQIVDFTAGVAPMYPASTKGSAQWDAAAAGCRLLRG